MSKRAASALPSDFFDGAPETTTTAPRATATPNATAREVTGTTVRATAVPSKARALETKRARASEEESEEARRAARAAEAARELGGHRRAVGAAAARPRAQRARLVRKVFHQQRGRLHKVQRGAHARKVLRLGARHQSVDGVPRLVVQHLQLAVAQRRAVAPPRLLPLSALRPIKIIDQHQISIRQMRVALLGTRPLVTRWPRHVTQPSLPPKG